MARRGRGQGRGNAPKGANTGPAIPAKRLLPGRLKAWQRGCVRRVTTATPEGLGMLGDEQGRQPGKRLQSARSLGRLKAAGRGARPQGQADTGDCRWRLRSRCTAR